MTTIFDQQHKCQSTSQKGADQIMKYIVFLLTIVSISVSVFVWQSEGHMQNQAVKRLKNRINYAAHDASLQVQDITLNNGKVVFDRIQADQAFHNTLELNNTKQYEILYKDYLDDSNTTFPLLYKNEQYSIQKLVKGPSVVYVAKVPHPNPKAVDPFISDWVVFEYPYK